MLALGGALRAAAKAIGHLAAAGQTGCPGVADALREARAAAALARVLCEVPRHAALQASALHALALIAGLDAHSVLETEGAAAAVAASLAAAEPTEVRRLLSGCHALAALVALGERGRAAALAAGAPRAWAAAQGARAARPQEEALVAKVQAMCCAGLALPELAAT